MGDILSCSVALPDVLGEPVGDALVPEVLLYSEAVHLALGEKTMADPRSGEEEDRPSTGGVGAGLRPCQAVSAPYAAASRRLSSSDGSSGLMRSSQPFS